MQRQVQAPLPIDSHLAEITEHVRRARTAVIVAPPGSGKTTRVPPALTALGRTILLQPRRVAARALARRIAFERGWTIGEEIGWQIRFERRFSRDTRLLVATEGILTARLQSDPLLSDFRVVSSTSFTSGASTPISRSRWRSRRWTSRDDLARRRDVGDDRRRDRSSRFLGGARVFESTRGRFRSTIRYRAGRHRSRRRLRDTQRRRPLLPPRRARDRAGAPRDRRRSTRSSCRCTGSSTSTRRSARSRRRRVAA